MTDKTDNGSQPEESAEDIERRHLEEVEELAVETLVPSLLSPLSKTNLIDRLLNRHPHVPGRADR